MHTVHQCIRILMYQLIMSVVTDAGISCAWVYHCLTQILTYQLSMSVVADADISAEHECNVCCETYQLHIGVLLC